MHFWNIANLTSELKNNGVSEKSEIQYLIMFFVIQSLGVLTLQVGIEHSLKQAKIEELITLVIACIGIYLCYGANREHDSQDFIKRFVSLSLPATVRFLALFLLPLLIIIFALGESLGGWPPYLVNKYANGARGMVILESLYWYYMYSIFKELSVPEQEFSKLAKVCPFCAEKILVSAIVCKHCQREIT